MSSELNFKRQLRNNKRKRKIKNNLILFVLSLIIITVFILCVKGIFTNFKNNSKEPTQFIFNGYVYPEPPPKNDDMMKDLKRGDGVKTAYLTFDDGPNETVTVRVLDILRKYNIKATFFMVGTLIEKNSHVARRIYDEGHLLANHSYSHNYSELYADKDGFMNQVNKTQELINGIVKRDDYPKIFRFPGGGFDTGKYGPQKQEYKLLLNENKFRYCDWNSMTGDAETSTPTYEQIMKTIKSTTRGQEDSVILLHDALAKKITPETLAEVIEYLISQGYVFDTIDNI